MDPARSRSSTTSSRITGMRSPPCPVPCSSAQRSACACIRTATNAPGRPIIRQAARAPEFRSLPGFAASRSREPRTVAWVSVPPVPCVPCLSQVLESGTKLFPPASLGPRASLMWPACRLATGRWPPASAIRQPTQHSSKRVCCQGPTARPSRASIAAQLAKPSAPAPSPGAAAPGGDVHSERTPAHSHTICMACTYTLPPSAWVHPAASSLEPRGRRGAARREHLRPPRAPLRRALRTATSAAGQPGYWVLVGWAFGAFGQNSTRRTAQGQRLHAGIGGSRPHASYPVPRVAASQFGRTLGMLGDPATRRPGAPARPARAQMLALEQRKHSHPAASAHHTRSRQHIRHRVCLNSRRFCLSLFSIVT